MGGSPLPTVKRIKEKISLAQSHRNESTRQDYLGDAAADSLL